MKRWQWAVLVMLVLGLALFAGCSEDDDDDDAGSSVLMPLAEGNNWIFAVTTAGQTQSDTMQMDLTMELDGKTWYGESDTDDPETELDETLYFRNGADGLYAYSMTEAGALQGLVFKFPATAGETFDSFVPGQSVAATWTVESISEAVVVPAGTFNNCYHYSTTADLNLGELGVLSADISVYAKPGIGLVKQSFTVSVSGTELVTNQNLTSYTLN